jgi:hypothetical protein
MTERKPPEISFTSWVDRQINEATERGAFENLPGAGKPLPNRGRADDQAWLRDYLRREGVSAEDLLPVPLRLRKEIERLTGTVRELPSEQQVRDFVAGLNHRIVEWRRIPLGPQVFLPRVDEETVVRQWREGRAGITPRSSPAPVGPGQNRRTPRSRWWHRLGRGGSVRYRRAAGREGRP